MKLIISTFVVIIIISCASQRDINLLPMYGNQPKPPKLIETDNKFIDYSIKTSGTRDSAARSMIELGWRYFYSNKYDIAMKRFNQAWLLDSTNSNIYWGFGSILGQLGYPFDSVMVYYKMSLNRGNKNVRFMTNIGFAFAQKAYQMKLSNDKDWIKIADSAFKYYDCDTLPTKENCDLTLRRWESALLLEMEERANRAKQIVDSTGIMPQNKEYYDYLLNKYKK